MLNIFLVAVKKSSKQGSPLNSYVSNAYPSELHNALPLLSNKNKINQI